MGVSQRSFVGVPGRLIAEGLGEANGSSSTKY
jgi:hypothetical protein